MTWNLIFDQFSLFPIFGPVARNRKHNHGVRNPVQFPWKERLDQGLNKLVGLMWRWSWGGVWIGHPFLVSKSRDMCLHPAALRAGVSWWRMPILLQGPLYHKGLGTNQSVCVWPTGREGQVPLWCIPPCPFTGELRWVFGDPCQGRTRWSHSTIFYFLNNLLA